jgi:hypothetical protein
MDAAQAVAFLGEWFRGTEGDTLICALPEPRDAPGAGRPKEYRLARPVEPKRIHEIFELEDRPNRALFVCVSTLKPDAVKTDKGFWRAKRNVWQCPGAWIDIDFRHVALSTENAIAEVTKCINRSRRPRPPGLRVLTGAGLHGYWRTEKPLEGLDELDQAEACMRVLAHYFGADPAVAEVARLMRLPGTFNWKYGEARKVMLAQSVVVPIDIFDERLCPGKPLVELAPSDYQERHQVAELAEAGPTAELNLFEYYSLTNEQRVPLDPAARLEAMNFHGTDGSGVHHTQLSVTASLLNQGMPRDEVVETVLEATMGKPFADGWKEPEERKTIEGMVDDWIAKQGLEAPPARPNGASGHPALASRAKTPARPAIRFKPFAIPSDAATPRRDFVLGRHYARRYVGGTVGISGAGKSSLVLTDMAVATSGKPLLGVAPDTGPVTVAYFNGEDPMDEIVLRLKAICVQHKIEQADIAERLNILSGRARAITLAATSAMRHSAAEILVPELALLREEIRRLDAAIVVFDPLISIHALNENDNSMMKKLIEALANELAEPCDCAVHIVHHVRKTTEEVTIMDARGASSIVDALRSARVLNTMRKEEAPGFGIAERDRRRYFREIDGKTSLAAPSDMATWYRLESVQIFNGLPPTEVQAVVRWESPGIFSGITPIMIAAACDIVRNGDYRAWSTSPLWVGRAIAVPLDINPDSSDGNKRLKTIIACWLQNSVLKIEVKEDQYRKPKEFIVLGPAAPAAAPEN